MKLSTCTLVALVALGASEVRAQVISRPPITPFSRPGFGGYSGPYGGLFGPAFGSGFGLGSNLFGQNYYPGPTGPSPTAPGYATPGITGRQTMQQPVETGTAGVTGHPTRFFYYGHYFLNQGGGATNVVSTGVRAPEAIAVVGGEYARGIGGSAPQRPTRTPSRGGR